jgi:hypothetical protein
VRDFQWTKWHLDKFFSASDLLRLCHVNRPPILRINLSTNRKHKHRPVSDCRYTQTWSFHKNRVKSLHLKLQAETHEAMYDTLIKVPLRRVRVTIVGEAAARQSYLRCPWKILCFVRTAISCWGGGGGNGGSCDPSLCLLRVSIVPGDAVRNSSTPTNHTAPTG